MGNYSREESPNSNRQNKKKSPKCEETPRKIANVWRSAKNCKEALRNPFGVSSQIGVFSWRFFTLWRFFLALLQTLVIFFVDLKFFVYFVILQKKSPKCEETPRKIAKMWKSAKKFEKIQRNPPADILAFLHTLAIFLVFSSHFVDFSWSFYKLYKQGAWFDYTEFLLLQIVKGKSFVRSCWIPSSTNCIRKVIGILNLIEASNEGMYFLSANLFFWQQNYFLLANLVLVKI